MKKLLILLITLIPLPLLGSTFFPIGMPSTNAQAILRLTDFTPYTEITLEMYALTQHGGKTSILCTEAPNSFGCTAFPNDPAHPYPYETNTITIPIETNYLLDVVPRESETYYHPTALKAQAVAARTYAYWHILDEESNVPINNSNSFQVFIPYWFENRYPNPNFPDNEQYPCNSNLLHPDQKMICDAVSDPFYITHHSTPDKPAFAEFSSDVFAQTVTHANPIEQPHLMSVEDPISTSCDANNFGHRKGMSQEGASRWARGDQCSYNSAGNQPWSVQWKDYRQILAHYYTGIHLRNFETEVVTPGKRWNMLQHTIRSVLPRGETVPISVRVQNTSTLDWGSSHFLAYRWKRDPSVGEWQTTAIPAALAAGETSPEIVIQLDIPWVQRAGGYILEWDVGELLNNDIVWFSEQNLPSPIEAWPTYNKSVAVVNPAFIPYALDIYYVLDVSGSMGQFYEGADNKLAAAKEAIMLANSFLNDAASESPWMDNRIGLISFYGGQNGNGNPPTYAVETLNKLAFRPFWGGLTDDFSAFDNKLLALSAHGSTPTYHALDFAKAEMAEDNEGGRKPVIVLLSDGVPTLSSERYSFDDSDVQAVPVRNGTGFRSIDEVRVDGGSGGAPGYFNGEPLADVMEEVQQGALLHSIDNLNIHTVAIQGIEGNTFQKDILEYVAAYGGGYSYEDDEVLDLGQSILDALLQSAYSDGPLPTPTPAPTSTAGPPPTPTKMPPPLIHCAVEWLIDYFGWGEESLKILQIVRDKALAHDESGRRYIDLFEKHSPEVVSLMAEDYELAKLGHAVIAHTAKFALPLIEPMDEHDMLRFDREYEELVNKFLHKLYFQASPELAQELSIWLERISLFHGMTAEEIWKWLRYFDG